MRLDLEFVYGYDGFQATSPNIFYTRNGEVVYFAAGVGIVYNKQSHTQVRCPAQGYTNSNCSCCCYLDSRASWITAKAPRVGLRMEVVCAAMACTELQTWLPSPERSCCFLYCQMAAPADWLTQPCCCDPAPCHSTSSSCDDGCHDSSCQEPALEQTAQLLLALDFHTPHLDFVLCLFYSLCAAAFLPGP